MAFQRDTKNCNVMVFTETWLVLSIRDSDIIPEGVSIHRCSPDLEHLMIGCWPYYLPREFTLVVVIAVYIPPHADTSQALDELYGCFYCGGDLNNANQRKVLPRYYQHISCPPCGENVLDHVPTPFRDLYNALSCPPFDKSDHVTVRTFPNQKPWANGEVCAKLTQTFFNLSLLQSVVPTCFKKTTIVHVPQKPKTLCLKDYRTVALTSVIMKRFEHLVKTFITSSLPDSLDPLM